MTSALRTRAKTESAQADVVGGRREPVLLTLENALVAGLPDAENNVADPPNSRPGAFKEFVSRLVFWRRLNLLSVSHVVLGMGLAVLSVGLILHVDTKKANPLSTPKFDLQDVDTASSVDAPVSKAELGAGHESGATQQVLANTGQDQAQTLKAANSAEENSVVSSASPDTSELMGPPLNHPVPAPEATVPATSLASQQGNPDPGSLGLSSQAGVVEQTKNAEPKQLLAQSLAPSSIAVSQFGLDADNNGVPDNLERWLEQTLVSREVKEAAHKYYQVVLPLANKLSLDIALAKDEQLSIFRSAECYLLTAKALGLSKPPNLNNPIFMQSDMAAAALKKLIFSLQTPEFEVFADRSQACATQ